MDTLEKVEKVIRPVSSGIEKIIPIPKRTQELTKLYNKYKKILTELRKDKFILQ